MNRRNLFSIGLLALGLLIGILIGRWFMPDRYGLLTMTLLVGGGIVTGALLTIAIHRRLRPERAGPEIAALDTNGMPVVNSSNTWKLEFRETRLSIRYDAAWWERTRADWRTRATTKTGGLAWFAVLCLFGTVGLAMYGQYSFAKETGFGTGMVAYLVAIVSFILLVLYVDRSIYESPNARAPVSDKVNTASPGRGRLLLVILAVLGALTASMVGATARSNNPQRENIGLWLGACVIYALAFVPWANLIQSLRALPRAGLRALGERIWEHRIELILLGAIMALAFVVRYWRLAWIPGIFGGDEGEMGSEALGVLNGGLKNPFVTGWLSHPTLFFFIQAFSLELFGQTVYGLRLLGVFGGTLSVFVSYLLIRRLFNVRLALLTAALLAAYNFHIHFSRLALNNIFDVVFAPLVLLLVYAGLETRRAAYFAMGGMAMGLAMYFYHGARLIPLILLVFGIYLLLTERALIFKNRLNFIWLGLGALIVSGPLLYFFYLHPDDLVARLTQRGIFQSGWFDAQIKNGRGAVEILLEQGRRSFLAFNAVPDPTNWFGTGQPLLDPLSGMFFVLGVVYGILRLEKKNYALLLIWLVAGIVTGSILLENPPTSSSFVILTVPAMFFVALGLDKIIALAAQVLRPMARIRRGFVVVTVVLIAAWSLAFYFIEYTPRYIYGGEPSWVMGVLTDHLKQRSDKYYVYFVAPPYMYLNIGTRKFIMPHVNGEDVSNPITSAQDLDFVSKGRPALFVFVPARANEFPIVQQTFPGGSVREFNKPDGKPLFFIYQVKTH